MTWLISDEARKHRAFREVWVAYLLGGLYLLLGLYTEISDQNYSVRYDAQQKWWFVQQNIRSYGATLTAFLLAVGLPRLVCCEKEYRTDDLVGTAALGRRCTWRAKTAFTVLYCPFLHPQETCPALLPLPYLLLILSQMNLNRCYFPDRLKLVRLPHL